MQGDKIQDKIQDKIISALTGLAGACSGNPKTANTDGVIIKALALPLINPDMDEGAVESIVREIHAEKNAVAPNCARCQNPCGNTSDYDMRRLYAAKDEIRRAKLQILDGLRELAFNLYKSGEKPDTDGEIGEIFYKSLAYLGYDMEETPLLALLAEIEDRKQEINNGRIKNHDKTDYQNRRKSV